MNNTAGSVDLAIPVCTEQYPLSAQRGSTSVSITWGQQDNYRMRVWAALTVLEPCSRMYMYVLPTPRFQRPKVRLEENLKANESRTLRLPSRALGFCCVILLSVPTAGHRNWVRSRL